MLNMELYGKHKIKFNSIVSFEGQSKALFYLLQLTQELMILSKCTPSYEVD